MGKGTQHKNDWKPTKLQACIDALSLSNYTSHIVSNQNVFKPELDFNNYFREKLVETADSIYYKAWLANKISTKEYEATKEMFADRLKLQAESIELCDLLLCLIEKAWKQFHLSTRKVSYWAEKTLNVENMLIKWNRSDIRKYMDYTKRDLFFK